MEDDKLTDCNAPFEDQALCAAASTGLLDAWQTAEQMRCLLQKEADTLRRFETRELLEITHRKESLVRELAQKMNNLKDAEGDLKDSQQSPQYGSLKACLEEMDRLNRSNRVFIQGALAHYQDFVECLCPTSYAPHRPGEQRKDLAAFKGLSLRKEI